MLLLFFLCGNSAAKELNPHIEFQNYKIAYHVYGQGENTLLFIHGLPLSSSSWECQVHYFKDKYRVITIDLPGYGESSKLKDLNQTDLSYFYADSIREVLKQLSIDKVNYIGFATGGHVGIAFAVRYPELVDRLVLIETSPQFAKFGDWPYGFDKQAVEYFNQAFDTKNLEAIAQILLQPAMLENCQQKLGHIKQIFTQMTIQCGVATLKAFFNNIALENFRPLLPNIKAKTLIIQATSDKVVVPQVTLYMRNTIPAAQLVEIEGADHFVFATRVTLINSLIENFISPECQLCQYNK